jgi:hypothetical protein
MFDHFEDPTRRILQLQSYFLFEMYLSKGYEEVILDKSEEDLFRASFKSYKSTRTLDTKGRAKRSDRKIKESQPDESTLPASAALPDLDELLKNGEISERILPKPSTSCRCSESFGLQPIGEWKVYEFKFPQGTLTK